MTTYLSTFAKYATFQGRARRFEFGIFFLINVIIAFVLGFFDGLMGTPLAAIFNLIILCPSLAVGSRRLHDMGYSGWWQLLYLLPLVGFVVMLVLAFKDGTPGENRFGPDPKGRVGTQPQAQAQAETDTTTANNASTEGEKDTGPASA
ncbi:MAG: membrane protein [Marinobacter sp. T13-3]|nr:MAG: membrane protein [Marinobacter sp. T13-3]